MEPDTGARLIREIYDFLRYRTALEGANMKIKRIALAVILIVIAAGLLVFKVVSDRYHASMPEHLLMIVSFLCLAAIIILGTGLKK
jgi:hypothetical protein